MCDTIQVRVSGGYIVATASRDPDYPGIDVEYVSDQDNGRDLSRPRVLMESPTDENGLIRALVWGDNHSEDYTEEIVFQKL